MSGTRTPFQPAPPPYSSPFQGHDTNPWTPGTNAPAPTEQTPLNPSPKPRSRRYLTWSAIFLLGLSALSIIVFAECWTAASVKLREVRTERQKLDHHRTLVRDEVSSLEKQKSEIQLHIDDLAERERAQDESRKMLAIWWERPRAKEYCESYGVRWYWARLHDIPLDFDGVRACYKKVHPELGVAPLWCEKNEYGWVYGHWRVKDDMGCKIWWSRLEDKGCTAPGSGKRMYEQHMENLQSGDDWNSICSTAPTEFNGQKFDKPDHCANRGRQGIFGVWEVDDDGCRADN